MKKLIEKVLTDKQARDATQMKNLAASLADTGLAWSASSQTK